MLAYARKQNRSTIFEWVEEDRGWFWHVDDYPAGWEKKVKETNILMLSKKGSTKPKSAKKGDDSSEACSDIVPFKSGLPPIGNIVLESSPPPSKRMRGSKRKTSPPAPTTTERRVCYL